MKDQKQCESILNHLQRSEYVLSDDIVYYLGIPRAAARIYELKERGHNIETIKVDKNGKKKHAYRLVA